MTEQPEVLAERRAWQRKVLKHQRAEAARKGGAGVFLGMLALGVAGFFAWRNRDRIAQTARPMIDDAKAKSLDMLDKAAAKSHDVMDNAATTGHRLVDTAKTRGQALAAKARVRRTDAGDGATLEVH
jgi:hypothetical protein